MSGTSSTRGFGIGSLCSLCAIDGQDEPCFADDHFIASSIEISLRLAAACCFMLLTIEMCQLRAARGGKGIGNPVHQRPFFMERHKPEAAFSAGRSFFNVGIATSYARVSTEKEGKIP